MEKKSLAKKLGIRFYVVTFEIHRNGGRYLGWCYALTSSKARAVEQVRNLFGYKDPHPYYVTAFRDTEFKTEDLYKVYDEEVVNGLWKWDVDKMCLVRKTDGKECRV